MMQFDKQKAHSVTYSFTFTVVLPDLEEKVYTYTGDSYEQYLNQMRQAQQQIEYLYELIERPEVTEF